MSSCRNTLLAIGPEIEVARFVSFTVAEETTFTEHFDTAVLCRDVGWVRLEVMSRWNPPLEVLADTSRRFPELRFAVEWEGTTGRISVLGVDLAGLTHSNWRCDVLPSGLTLLKRFEGYNGMSKSGPSSRLYRRGRP